MWQNGLTCLPVVLALYNIHQSVLVQYKVDILIFRKTVDPGRGSSCLQIFLCFQKDCCAWAWELLFTDIFYVFRKTAGHGNCCLQIFLCFQKDCCTWAWELLFTDIFMFLERLLYLGMGTVVYRYFYVFRKTAVPGHGNYWQIELVWIKRDYM